MRLLYLSHMRKSINADVSGGARSLNIGLHLHPYFVYATSKGSHKSVYIDKT